MTMYKKECRPNNNQLLNIYQGVPVTYFRQANYSLWVLESIMSAIYQGQMPNDENFLEINSQRIKLYSKPGPFDLQPNSLPSKLLID